MYLLMRYPAGITREAVILAKGRNRMRIVVAGEPDTIELKRLGPEWLAGEGQPVEFDFLMASVSESDAVSVSTRACATRTAAG